MKTPFKSISLSFEHALWYNVWNYLLSWFHRSFNSFYLAMVIHSIILETLAQPLNQASWRKQKWMTRYKHWWCLYYDFLLIPFSLYLSPIHFASSHLLLLTPLLPITHLKSVSYTDRLRLELYVLVCKLLDCNTFGTIPVWFDIFRYYFETFMMYRAFDFNADCYSFMTCSSISVHVLDGWTWCWRTCSKTISCAYSQTGRDVIRAIVHRDK